MQQCRYGRRTEHGILQPALEWDLRRLAHSGHEEQHADWELTLTERERRPDLGGPGRRHKRENGHVKPEVR